MTPFKRNTFISDMGVTFSHSCFEKALNATVVYHCSIQHVPKKYYILYIRCLRIAFIKTSHLALILGSWDLIYCPIVGNRSNFRKYWFHEKEPHKLSIETSYRINRWTNECIFKMFCLRENCSISHTFYM